MDETNTLFKSQDPFNISFTLMKVRYNDYGENLKMLGRVLPNDKINVFINLEGVYNKISTIRYLDSVMISCRDADRILVSEILNLAAHYKRFFTATGFEVKVFLYQTALTSDTFHESVYNTYYRSHYLCKFTQNPKIAPFTELLLDSVLDEVKTYCEFIPNVYFIDAVNIEGSLVPQIIANADPTRNNFIITRDYVDTQYDLFNAMGGPKYTVSYASRHRGPLKIRYSLDDYILDIGGDTVNGNEQLMHEVYCKYPFYCTLLSVMADSQRSLNGVHGVGPKILTDKIVSAVGSHKLTKETSSVELLANLFDDEDGKIDFTQAYNCLNLYNTFKLLTDADKKSVLQQIVDRSDVNTLNKLNATRFATHPIRLESLL